MRLEEAFAVCERHAETVLLRIRKWKRVVWVTLATPGTSCETCGIPAVREIWG